MKAVAACAVILVIVLNCEKCFSLEYHIETKDDVKKSQSDEVILEAEIPDSYGIKPETKQKFPVSFVKLFGNTEDQIEDASDDTDGGFKKRVVRQAYQGQTHLYPNLPSGPPYGLEPYPNSNNQNPSHNPQWQNSYNNHSQPGYPSQTNGYQPSYKPSNYTNYNPSGPYGQNSQPNSWQPNGYQPNNNPYGTNTQVLHNNPTQPGYNPSNLTNNNPHTGPYGQNPPPWQPQNQPSNSQRSYNPTNGSYPSYNSNAQTPYPGYKPSNTGNNSSFRPAYNQPGQFQNNSYSGYPSHTPGYRPANSSSPYPYNPNQKPQYYPGQSQLNGTGYPQGGYGNQHPVIYDGSTKGPGQNPYSSYNASNWSGNTLNNTQGQRPPYGSQNGQNSQYYNSYPGSPGYGQQNSNNPYNTPNQRSPYQDPQFGQYPSNSYPGRSSDSATFNLANGYNPNIPNKPPYGSGPYGQSSPSYYPNGTLHDPTKVSPVHFNSY